METSAPLTLKKGGAYPSQRFLLSLTARQEPPNVLLKDTFELLATTSSSMNQTRARIYSYGRECPLASRKYRSRLLPPEPPAPLRSFGSPTGRSAGIPTPEFRLRPAVQQTVSAERPSPSGLERALTTIGCTKCLLACIVCGLLIFSALTSKRAVTEGRRSMIV